MPNQPRKVFNEDALQELADSIRQHGLIEPLIVQEGSKGFYQIIAGERRWRAAKIAGLKEIPVIIKEYTAQEVMEIALIENIQREDLNPIEEAEAYQRLITEYHLKQDEVAEKVSKSRVAVTNTLRLLKLDERVRSMLIEDKIKSGHARALLAIEDGDKQYETAVQIFDEKLSVRETGIFLMIILPMAANIFFQKKGIKSAVLKRRGIFYFSFLAVFFPIIKHGNRELFLGFILGSSLCCLLVFEGMWRLFSERKREVLVRRDRNYFFSFSVILVLILSADYLFFRRTEGNRINQVDGLLLLLLLFVFLFAEVRNYFYPAAGSYSSYRELLGDWFRQTGKAFSFWDFLVVISICAGGYFLVDGLIGACIWYHIRFQIAGVLILPWAVHAVNFISGRDKAVMEEIKDAMTFDAVFLFLFSFGMGAVLMPVGISYADILSFIVMSVFSIFLVWRDQVHNRIAGSLMLTMYVAGVVMMGVV